ncbi:hypothetical protein NQ176_g8754 [Zarea fungicola]|uniref:Uncharacterized protein n=1 Tax=Zarea fungicola TaxID=93591 RepID=A0ACC1MRD2_9HYPO|nr:hypothetical protein NQ176_g8754 [Lecanicillium fungicola]
MKLSVLALSSYFVASALAANCWGSVSGIPSELLHVYWDARNQMYIWDFGNKQLSVILQRRKNGVKGFHDCYSAAENIIGQCVYSEHALNGKWEYAGQTYTMVSSFVDTTPPPEGCNLAKYCAYTFRNDECRITTWKGDGRVPVFFECLNDRSCSGGAKCVNRLCCHADKLVLGEALCPTISDLQHCGGFQREVENAAAAAWSPPHTDIPAGLKYFTTTRSSKVPVGVQNDSILD